MTKLMENFGFGFFEKGQILRPSNLKTENISKKIQGQAMCAQRNRLIPYLIWIMGRENRPWTRGLKDRREKIKIKKVL